MLRIEDYAAGFWDEFPFLPHGLPPWQIVARLATLLDGASAIAEQEPGLRIHPSAVIEAGAVLKPPVLIAADCFVAAHAYLRGGVALGRGARVGPGCEVKTSLVMSGTTLAHLNFVGDSILGRDVNLEAGAICANRWNERADKAITIASRGERIATGVDRLGALIGDGCRVGANAVLCPGTVLAPGAIVARLQLVDQSAG